MARVFTIRTTVTLIPGVGHKICSMARVRKRLPMEHRMKDNIIMDLNRDRVSSVGRMVHITRESLLRVTCMVSAKQ